MEVQQKQFSTQIKALDEKGRVLLAVNAIGNTDSDLDISMPGSFTKTLKENFSRVRWFLNHNTTQLLGVPISGKENNGYLEMEAQFNMKKQLAIDTYNDYKLYAEHGNTLEHSIGVQAIKYDINNDTGIRKVSEWKLWEFSTLTHWGANEDTPMIGIKNRAAEPHSTRKQYLFIEPSRYTQEDEAAIKTILNSLKIN